MTMNCFDSYVNTLVNTNTTNNRDNKHPKQQHLTEQKQDLTYGDR